MTDICNRGMTNSQKDISMIKNRYIFSEKDGEDWVSVDSAESLDTLKKQLKAVTDEKDALTETFLKHVDEQEKLLRELHNEREKNLQLEKELKEKNQIDLRVMALTKELEAEKAIVSEVQNTAKINAGRLQIVIENLMKEREVEYKDSSKRNQSLSDALKKIKQLEEEILSEKQKNLRPKTYAEAHKSSLRVSQAFHQVKKPGF